jgi:type IX secretion system PorP/SprF family membrane protein
LKLFHIRILLSICIVLLLSVAGAKAQEVHFAQVKDLNLWYNPALKTNKLPLANINIRNVQYKHIVSYSNKAATVELPFTGTEEDNSGFLSVAAGINTSSTSDGSLHLSALMLASSYALPLDYDNTYLAAGAQIAYTFSRISANIYYPEKFDPYGPIATAIYTDPLQTGFQYNYFTVGAGAAFFHDGINRQWYIGASVGHVNQPVTNPGYPSRRLPISHSIQAGYTTSITNKNTINGYAVFNWQGRSYEHLAGLSYTRNLIDSVNAGIFVGAGYRIGDAFIPHIGLVFRKHRLIYNYEFNISRNEASMYNRKAYEFSYRYLF